MKSISGLVLPALALMGSQAAAAPDDLPTFAGIDKYGGAGCTEDLEIAFRGDRLVVKLDGTRADLSTQRGYGFCGFATWMDPESLPTNYRFRLEGATFKSYLKTSDGGYLNQFSAHPGYQSTWGNEGDFNDTNVGVGGSYIVQPVFGGRPPPYPYLGEFDGPVSVSTSRSNFSPDRAWTHCFTEEYKEAVERPTFHAQIVGWVSPENPEEGTEPVAVLGADDDDHWLTVEFDVVWEEC